MKTLSFFQHEKCALDALVVTQFIARSWNKIRWARRPKTHRQDACATARKTSTKTFVGKICKGLKSKFTLVEVVVALAVLGFAIISASAMCSQAITRITKAKARWTNQHMISQAAEYYLLAGPKSQVTNEIFPYRNVRVNCTVVNADGLPSGVDAVFGQWRLATYEIRLTGARGENLHSLKIDKIIQVSD